MLSAKPIMILDSIIVRPSPSFSFSFDQNVKKSLKHFTVREPEVSFDVICLNCTLK